MTIDLPNGFSYRDPDIDFETIFLHLDDWRARLYSAHQQCLARIMARNASRLIDRIATSSLFISRPEEPTSPLNLVRTDIKDRQSRLKATGMKDPEIDFTTQVIIFPNNGNFWGLLICEQSNWRDAFFLDRMIEPKPYLDSMECPDDLTDADWMARRDIWESLLERDVCRRPSHAGVIFELTPPPIFPDIRSILSELPAFNSRIDFIAREIILERSAMQTTDPSDSLAIALVSASEMETPKGRRARGALAHQIAPRLKMHLSEADLRGG